MRYVQMVLFNEINISVLCLPWEAAGNCLQFCSVNSDSYSRIGYVEIFKNISLSWNALPRQRLVGVQGIPLNIQVEGMVFGHTTSGLRTQVASGAWWFDLTMIDHSSWRIVVFLLPSPRPESAAFCSADVLFWALHFPMLWCAFLDLVVQTSCQSQSFKAKCQAASVW